MVIRRSDLCPVHCVVRVRMELPYSWCSSGAMRERGYLRALCGTSTPAAEELAPNKGFSARKLFPRGDTRRACGVDAFAGGQSGTLVSHWVVFPKQWYAEPGKD